MKLRAMALLLAAGFALFGVTACAQLSTLLRLPQPPCTVEKDLPARLFTIEAPETAVADQPFSVVAWVSLGGDYNQFQVPLAETFKADVDPEAKTITLSGSVRTDVANPENPDCILPAGMQAPKGATMSIRVSAPAGIYTLRIPDEAFTAEKPISAPHPGVSGRFDYPEPMATRSIAIQEPS